MPEVYELSQEHGGKNARTEGRPLEGNQVRLFGGCYEERWGKLAA